MNATKRLSVAAVIAALALLGAALLGGVAEAKKKKSKPFKATKVVGLAIPDAGLDPVPGPGDGLHGVLRSTIDVPKKFRNKLVGADSIRVTFQTIGVNPKSAEDVDVRLINGKSRAVNLGTQFVGQSIGPVTETPNSTVERCDSLTVPCGDPNASLRPPYFGTFGNDNLAWYTGTKVGKNWTIEFQDTENGNTSIALSWSIEITTTDPPLT